jgi:methionine-rich copper-binding protein CopC
MTHFTGRAARGFAIAFSALLLLGSAPAVVLAHANLGQSAPSADQTLAGAPPNVSISFTETPDPSGTGLTVQDSVGGQVDLGNQVVSPADKQASVGLSPIGPGVYTVAWFSRSAEDGDDAKGFFAFAVGAPSAPPVASIQGTGGANPGQSRADELSVSLAALPAEGPHTFEVAVASSGQPVVDAQRVSLRLSSSTTNLGTSVVMASPQGDGRYLATTWLPGLPGSWQADVIVRRAGLDDSVANFSIQVGS